MVADPLLVPVRDVLARLGDRALPAPSWERIVEVDVEPGAEPKDPRSSRGLAVAAALVLLIGAVGVWRLQQDDDRASYATPPGVDRTIAVPLFVPAGMAYDGADVGAVGVPGYDGVAQEGTVSASWSRGDASLMVVSAPNSAGLEALPGREEPLMPMQTVTVVSDEDPIVVAWYSPTDSLATFGVRAVGLTLEEVLVVARSAWYVTPELWGDLSKNAGFRSLDDSRSGLDRWTPIPGPGDDEIPVFVWGSLQPSAPPALLIGLGRGGGFYGAGTPVDRCDAIYDGDNGVEQQVGLAGDADVVAFEVTDADGTVHQVTAQEHPGLPAYRFAVTTATPRAGQVRVTCEVES